MPEEPFAPRRVGNDVSLNITGYLFPWDIETDNPAYFNMPMSSDLYLPVFATLDGLERICRHTLRDTPYKVKHIDDMHEFLDSLPYWIMPDVRLRVIVDPYETEQKTIRFREVYREDDADHNTPETPSS